MPDAQPAGSKPASTGDGARSAPLLWTIAATLLVGTALWLRLLGMSGTARGGDIRFDDPDTLRRLVRLHHLLEPGTPYPYRDPADGWHVDPARRGTVIHWTLPMDGVILALDRVVAPWYPRARRFEAGAAWSGPLLGTLATVVFLLLAARWLTGPQALLATLLYALAYDPLVITAFGSGDHTSLLHLGALVALLGFFALLAGRGGARLAMLTGAGLGLGLWVSAEASVVLYVMAAGALASLLVGTREARATLARRHREWVLAASVVSAVGARLEHPGQVWPFEWDTVSGFQLHQLLVLLLFAVLAERGLARAGGRRAPLLAAAVALVAGLAPFVLLPAYRAALGEQLALAEAVNRWAQSEVLEFRGLLSIEGFFVPNQSWERFSWLVLALPVCAPAVALERHRAPALRAGLVIAALGLFGLACYEVKLGHLFAVVHPLVLVVGGRWLLVRVTTRLGAGGRATARVLEVAAGAAVVIFLLVHHPLVGLPLPYALTGLGPTPYYPHWDDDDPGNQLIRELRGLPAAAGDRRAVLAEWSFGGFVLYLTEHPVVASGYHRNLAGIRDSYRVFVARVPEDVPALAAILRERGVRWIVTRYDPALFVRGSRSFPELGEFGRTEHVAYRADGLYDAAWAPFPEQTRRTFLWLAHIGGHFAQPVRVGEFRISLYTEVPRGSFERGAMPNFIIYDVQGPGDP